MHDKKKKKNGSAEPVKAGTDEGVEQQSEKSDEERLADLKATYPDLLVKIAEREDALAQATDARKNAETSIGEIVGHGKTVAIDGKVYLVRNRPDAHGGGFMLVDAAKRAAAAQAQAEKAAARLANPA